MRRLVLLLLLLIFYSINVKAQTKRVFEITRDSISQVLSIEKSVANGLIRNLFTIEYQRLKNMQDTISSYQKRHEKRLLLAVEREAVLKKWLSDEKYQLWKVVYKGRLDPVMLAWKKEYTPLKIKR